VADLLKQQEEFRNMLEKECKPYEDLGNGLIIVVDGPVINIRQYHSEGFCLSSWVNSKDFIKKIAGLLSDANVSFASLIEGFNAQIKAMNENNLKVYDADNPEYFITGVEYSQDDDKLIFKTDEDPNEFNRLEELREKQNESSPKNSS